MTAHVTGLRYPSTRVLLPRTRLAYVHLRNLLTDAKRDRAARVSGYVAIWLPEDFVTLYMQGGEVVNASIRDRAGSRPIAIARAIEMVPPEPEYGEICFNEAEEDQLACMFAAQTTEPETWPIGLAPSDPAKLFPYLMSTTFDGAVEILANDSANYMLFKNGTVERAFLAAGHHGTLVDRVTKLFARETKLGDTELRRWPGPLTLPIQAPPSLIQAYRELATALVRQLVEHGRPGAASIAERARLNLVTTHPALDGLAFHPDPLAPWDPLADTAGLTSAVAAWLKEVVWATADHDQLSPEQVLRELTWERRHLFQAAGLYDQIPWKVL